MSVRTRTWLGLALAALALGGCIGAPGSTGGRPDPLILGVQ